MCLYTDKAKPFVSGKDIEVYKAVIVNRDGKTWRGPYYSEKSFPFDTEITEISKPETVKLSSYSSEYLIAGGWFHCVDNIEDGKRMIRNHNPYVNINLCKAVIPKGTEYHMDIHCKGCMATKTIVVANPRATPVLTTINFSELANCFLLHSAKRNLRNHTLITLGNVRFIARAINLCFDCMNCYFDYHDIVKFSNRYKGKITKDEYRHAGTVEILVNHYPGLKEELEARIPKDPVFEKAMELIEKHF
jgi:hypothetical protein